MPSEYIESVVCMCNCMLFYGIIEEDHLVCTCAQYKGEICIKTLEDS